VEFLRKTPPFNLLDEARLEPTYGRWVIDYYPKGALIFKQDVTEVTHLCLVQKGGVKVYFDTADTTGTLRDFGGEGAAFGALNILRGNRAELNVEAVEDTFCFLLEKEAFLELIASDPRFAGFFLEGLHEEMVCATYSEIFFERVKGRRQESLYLFDTQVQEVIRRAPESVVVTTTVQQAAARMDQLGIGSLLVRDTAGLIVGIVTDKDLRGKVVAEGLDYSVAVETVMTAPVRTIPARAVCFDAMLEHIRKAIDHLVLEDEQGIRGVVTAHDIMVYQGAWPLYLFREIVSQRTIEGLYDLSKKAPLAVRTLMEEGARPNHIMRVMTLLNDSILNCLLDLLLAQMGPPPVPFCWLSLGSDGRKEQTFRTDQDNALVYADPETNFERHAAEIYFEALGARAVDHLESCGYPRCKNDIMVSNSRWRQPYHVWEHYFDGWITSPDPREVASATIFFDFRPVYGDRSLAERLRGRLTDLVQRQHMFQIHLAGECLQSWPPLSFFRNFVVEKDGKRSNQLDLKSRGMSPFVNFARLMALRYGIEETNTLGRLQHLSENGHFRPEFCDDAREAYEFQIHLNLIHQLRIAETGMPAESRIDPAELSHLERRTLKEAFGVIDRLLNLVKQEFPSVM